MKRRLYMKIIVAAAGLILIGLAVALCVSREIGRTDKRRQQAAVEETVQPEKDPGRQAEQAGPSNDDQRDAAAGSDRDSADRQDPYEKLKQRLNKRKGTADYNGYLVTLKDNVDRQTIERLDRVGEDAGLTALQYTDRTYRAATTEVIRALIDTDDIERIEANFTVKLCDDAGIPSPDVPDDPYYKRGEQYNLQQLSLPAVWSKTVRGQTGLEGQDLDADVDLDQNGIADDDDIIIAVIDTGYKPGHEDMEEERVLPGVSFARDRDKPVEDPTDAQGHGTFIAGMLTAVKDNRKGIAGIGQAVKVLPIRVFVGRECDDGCIADAVNYAAEQREIYNDPDRTGGTGISVINMSLGSDEPNESIEEACERAKNAGIILISSAGNDGESKPSYPAQYTIGIGSTGKTGNISTFSQRLSADNGVGYANKVWVTAPGDHIRSIGLSEREYILKDGTSFSAPEIAALAALCKSIRNDCDHDRFMQLLRDSAVPRTGTAGDIDGQDIQYGWGQVDFERTIDALLAESGEPKTCPVSFAVRNEAGSDISGAAVTITDRTDTEIPEEDGRWTLTVGEKYRYQVTAPEPYGDKTAGFYAGERADTMAVILRGGDYPVRIEIVDQYGELIDSPDMKIKISSGNGTVHEKSEEDGCYHLPNGVFRCRVTDDGVDEKWDFTIDDQTQSDPAAGVTKRFELYREKPPARSPLKKVTGLSTSGDYAKRSFTVSFRACPEAGNYQIAWRQRGTSAWKSKWSGGRLSATIGSLKSGKLYEIRVRAYRADDGAYGEYSDSVYRMMRTTSVTARAGKGRVKVRWKKASGAEKYQVCCSANKHFANAKVITLGSGKRSYTIKGLKSNKRYYVRVRPIRRSGKTYTGIYSAAKRVKTR